VRPTGQERRQPGGEHGLARARRSEQEDVVPTRGRHEHRLHGVVVADHIGEVGRVLGRPGLRRDEHRVERDRVEVAPVPDHGVEERHHGDHPDAGHESRLIGVAGRHHRRGEAGPCGGDHGGEHARDRADPSVEAELAQVHHPVDRRRLHGAGRGQHGECDAQVEARAVLGQRRGREIDGDLVVRERAPGVRRSGPDPVLRLAEGRIRKTDEDERREIRRDVRLDLDDRAVQPEQGDRVGARDRHQNTRLRCSMTTAPKAGATMATASMRTRE
jgi:hypothetical protein